MPNPLRPNDHFHIGPGAVWERPDLARQIVTVISMCAASEYQLGSLLAVVAGTDAAEAIVGATKTRSNEAVKTLLSDHATTKLKGDAFRLVAALLTMAISVSKARNPFVHWLSGYSHNYLSGILLLNPKRQWRFDASVAVHRANIVSASRSAPPKYERRNILVYVQRDFDEVIGLVDEFNLAAELIKFLLSWGLPGPGRVYDRLRSLPRYAKELSLLP